MYEHMSIVSSTFHRLLTEVDQETKQELDTIKGVVAACTMITGCSIILPWTKYMQDDEEEDDKNIYICKNRLKQFGNCFAGGMLLAISTVHALPETI